MTPSDLARKNAIPMEVKKDGLQQRQNGDWMLRFVMQGSDMDVRLLNAPMGARFQAVLVEIGDDELPVQKEAAAKPRQDAPQYSRPDGAKRMDWREVQPAAQAGIRCAEPMFRAFLREVKKFGHCDENDAAVAVRDICGVTSRSSLGVNQKARVIWHQIDTEYQAWLAKERVGA